jgi:DNA-binding NarL/FixJ family response regulator
MEKKQIKILLIDDDEMMRIYFRDIFWIHGGDNKYEISMASSLAEAEKIISNKDTKPDTIFLDVMMIVKDGDNSPHQQLERTLSFIKKVREDKDLSSIKIIIYSGQKEKFIEDEFNKLGINGYLIKGELMPKEIIAFTDKLHEPNN